MIPAVTLHVSKQPHKGCNCDFFFTAGNAYCFCLEISIIIIIIFMIYSTESIFTQAPDLLLVAGKQVLKTSTAETSRALCLLPTSPGAGMMQCKTSPCGGDFPEITEKRGCGLLFKPVGPRKNLSSSHGGLLLHSRQPHPPPCSAISQALCVLHKPCRLITAFNFLIMGGTKVEPPLEDQKC